jgi:hypothetical protein
MGGGEYALIAVFSFVRTEAMGVRHSRVSTTDTGRDIYSGDNSIFNTHRKSTVTRPRIEYGRQIRLRRSYFNSGGVWCGDA